MTYRINGSPRLAGLRIAVAGAGVFGLCVALRFARAGADVTVFDPAPTAANASGVAAGMIAPFGELVYDGLDAGLWPLFQTARDAWLPLEASIAGVSLQRGGCVYRFDDLASEKAAKTLADTLGVSASNAPGAPALISDVDWWLDPRAALQSLLDAVRGAGGVYCASTLPSDATLRFDQVALCVGSGSKDLAVLAPALLEVTPIKGHIVRFRGAPSPGFLERRPDLYLTPQPYGVVAGATMEVGDWDPRVDPLVVEALRLRAIAMRPSLEGFACVGAAGVRMAAPDGLPIVGRDPASGALVATGARRNGWLFGPLVAEILLAYLTSEPLSSHAQRLSPSRLQGYGD
jgi:glycine oxidase